MTALTVVENLKVLKDRVGQQAARPAYVSRTPPSCVIVGSPRRCPSMGRVQSPSRLVTTTTTGTPTPHSRKFVGLVSACPARGLRGASCLVAGRHLAGTPGDGHVERGVPGGECRRRRHRAKRRRVRDPIRSDIGSRTRYLGCGGTGRGDMSYTLRARRSASSPANFAGSSGTPPSARRAVP
jgi:hypothetical protein